MKPIPFEAYHLVRRLTFHVILTLCLVAGASVIIDLYDPRMVTPAMTPLLRSNFSMASSLFLSSFSPLLRLPP